VHQSSNSVKSPSSLIIKPSSAYITNPAGGFNHSTTIVANTGEIDNPCGIPLRFIKGFSIKYFGFDWYLHKHFSSFLSITFIILDFPINIISLSPSGKSVMLLSNVYSTFAITRFINNASFIDRSLSAINTHETFIELKKALKSNSITLYFCSTAILYQASYKAVCVPLFKRYPCWKSLRVLLCTTYIRSLRLFEINLEGMVGEPIGLNFPLGIPTFSIPLSK